MNYALEVGKLYLVKVSSIYMRVDRLDSWNKTYKKIVLERDDIILLTSNKIIRTRHQTSWLTKYGPCYFEFNIGQEPYLDVLNE